MFDQYRNKTVEIKFKRESQAQKLCASDWRPLIAKFLAAEKNSDEISYFHEVK
jgi:hypothetical protein